MEPEVVRAKVVEQARSLVSLGADPSNAEVYRKYVELIAPGEDAATQEELAATSGAGLVVAGLFRRIGVSSKALDPPYALGTAVKRLMQVATDTGAWVPFAEGAAPSPGDVVLVTGAGGARHAYTVTAVKAEGGVHLETVEGGHRDERQDATIVQGKRAWKGNQDFVEGEQGAVGGEGRAIDGWIDVVKVLGSTGIAADAVVDFASDGTERLSPAVTRVSAGEMTAALTQAWNERFGSAPSPESIYVLVAQWALETGWGKAMHAFNIGNIKSVDGDGHDYTYFACNEVLGGKVVWFYPDNAGCRFRAYTTLVNGAADYLETINKRYSASWSAVVAGDPAAYAHLLKLQRYYTASEQQYTQSMVSIFSDLARTSPKPGAGAALPNLYTTLGVQQALKQLGYDPGTIDGKDGPHTQAAVEAFQRDSGLVADGIVGSGTRAALADALKAQAAGGAT